VGLDAGLRGAGLRGCGAIALMSRYASTAGNVSDFEADMISKRTGYQGGSVTKACRILLTILGAAVLAPPSLSLAAGEMGPTYTAYNIWWEKPDKVYSTNYEKGTLLPAGSEVKDVKIDDEEAEFTDVKTSVRFKVEFVGRHHPGVKDKAFWERFLTPKTFAELTQGFISQEIQAIKAGEIRAGMSKKAVLVARGYPPETRTPSLELDTCTYWHDRFRSYSVQFVDGKVVSVGK